MILDSVTDVTEIFASSSSSNRENETDVDIKVGNFVTAKIHSSQCTCRDNPSNSVGKTCKASGENNFYETIFHEILKHIKN